MNFTDAMKATTVDERNELIKSEIHDHFWGGDFDPEDLPNGGWADDVNVTKVEINDGENGGLLVQVEIEFSETVETTCEKISVPFRGHASCEILIDSDGEHDCKLEVTVNQTPDWDFL
ncbi:MAG TPA: hypothetical protein VHY91_05455 [Pirellulales bacterium]|nr:hypothetical protein [Pirellulales bacterium]